MPTLTLPDGKTLAFEAPVTAREAAEAIGKRLAKDAVAATVNGRPVDLSRVIDEDAEITILTPESEAGLEVMRHSASHVMAEAIVRLWPGTKLVYGPAIEEGFYYDVDCPAAISEEDLPAIEKEMKRIVKRNEPFHRFEVSREEARALVGENEYKLDNLERAEGEAISFYSHGEGDEAFTDLCRGPHVPSTGRIGAFAVLSVSGAYLHGDATQKQLTRVYGTTFASGEELAAYRHRLEEARKRDHRKLGRDLELFEFHPEAPGMAFFRPNGTVLYNQVLAYARELCTNHGYGEIRTPTILVRRLWETSGHWENYRDKMYTSEKDGRDYGVKPMNCPGGVILYNAGLHSHNDLPIRWAEFGHVHRHEGGGEIHGLVRVRGFTQDDAHIYCTPEQVTEEVAGCIRMVFELYETFGLTFDHIELSTRPEKRIGSDAMWDQAESALQQALDGLRIEYQLNPGDGAFYGPKIDFHLADAIGRTWQLGTIQVDFAMPEKFDMTYVDAQSERRRVVMIHRAITGSLERFLGILVEHYAGDFPLWLAPEQIRVLTITDAQARRALEVMDLLRGAGLRAAADVGPEKIGAKIRRAELAKIPYLAVIGDREVEDGTVSLRHRPEGDLGGHDIETVVARLSEEAATRTIDGTAVWS
jgi:threonyl-tRNA synthetase